MKILAPALLALALAASLHAQASPGMVVVRGTLVDAENGNRVINGGAWAEAAGARRRSAVTDTAGQFTLRLPRGSHFVVVSAPGFDAVAEVVDASADVDMGQIEMSPAVFALAPIAVTVSQLELRRQQSPISSRALSGRILQHSGDSDLYDFVKHRFGIRVSPCNFLDTGPMGECVYIRGKGERPRVFIDEVLAPSGMRQLMAYRPEDVERVEVYAGGKLMMIYTRGYLEMLARTRRITTLPPI